MPILIAAAFVPRPMDCPYRRVPCIFSFSYNIVYRACGDGVVQHADLYADLFYDFSAGSADPFYLLRGIPCGAIVPIPFFPEKIGRILELLPFASMQNVPLRIYSGSMSLEETARAAALQIAWLIVITALGKWLCWTAVRRVTVQGG